MELVNGLFMLQGFIESDGQLYLFEPGIRFDGTCFAHLVSKIYDINPVGWMLDLARGLIPEIDWSKVDLTSRKKYHAAYMIYCNPGTISSIEGENEVASLSGTEFLLKRYKVGDIVEDAGNMTQCAYFIQLVSNSLDEFICLLRTINKTLCILDQNGRNLLEFETDYEHINTFIN